MSEDEKRTDEEAEVEAHGQETEAESEEDSEVEAHHFGHVQHPK
jgi:hypothetical protein